MRMSDLRFGDTVTARLFGGEIVTGTIDGFGEKNGKDLIDIKTGSGPDRWCYLDQIISVNGVRV